MNEPQTAWDWLHEITKYMWSREGKPGFASKSEKKRWLLNKAVIVNGEPLVFNELIDFPVFSIVIFPKSDKNRTTLL